MIAIEKYIQKLHKKKQIQTRFSIAVAIGVGWLSNLVGTYNSLFKKAPTSNDHNNFQLLGGGARVFCAL